MDDLYDNLDNYNEESTIAELQSENKELKSKLEEYADTLGKLQKDILQEFDTLSSEYKQLELNYSSLLKTAKAEIERKTQIISNLNLEKDQMVLKCYQNRNAGALYKTRNSQSPVVQQIYKKDKERTNQGEKLKHLETRKSSSYSSTERKEETSSRDTTASPHVDLRSKLLNLAHSSQPDPKIDRNSEVKENIIQAKKDNDSYQARASIRNRRKSMPAIRNEVEDLSEDDDFVNTTSAKSKDRNLENNFSEKQKQTDHNFRERPKSKISETYSLEEKKSGHHQPNPDTHKQRLSRYDKDKHDQYRGRHKSSNRYKKQSPDRYHSGPKEHHDPHRRDSERYRDRGRGRVLESPPRDKFHHRSSREPHRSYPERSHPHDHEQFHPRSQERNPMKRKVDLSSEELENKRKRLEADLRQINEDQKMEVDTKRSKDAHRHVEEDQKIKHERKASDRKYIIDPLEIQFSSCESPDYDGPDVSTQQIREIKLTSSTKLDDPRLSNSRYVLKNNDDKVVLSTTIGRSVDIVPIQKAAWGIIPVNMPEALVKKPIELEQTTGNMALENVSPETTNTDITNPLNDSMESGEISNDDKKNYANCYEKQNNKKNSPVPVIKIDESTEEKSAKMNNYKIPKLKKSKDEKCRSKQSKEITSKPGYDTIDSNKHSKHLDIVIKDIDLNKHQSKVIKEKEKPEIHRPDSVSTQNKNQLPCLSTGKIFDNKYSAKEVVEGDLEMSDDNFDDEQTEYVTKEPIASMELTNNSKDKDKICNKNTEILSETVAAKVSPELSKVSTTNGKKSKIKKKSKHKESKDAHKNESSIKKKEKEKDPKPKHIKTKFTELFDDSSSLISPEDLGLPAPTVSATPYAVASVPFIEDALHPDDSCAAKPDVKLDLIPVENTNIEDTDIPITDLDSGKTYDDILEKSPEISNKANTMQTELTDDVIKSIYQNLEPSDPEHEKNVVNTVIISTGVQAPIIIEDENLPVNKSDPQLNIIHKPDPQLQIINKPEPLLKIIQDLGLQALATSTPQKIWQEKPAERETKQTDSISHNNTSDIANVENSATLNKSDSNTMDSQTIDAVPDVRIIVKRRRKHSKK